jgi:ribosomal protein L16 Arg81 hydroxylase
MKKKHQTNRTNIETLKELFKEFNTTYQKNYLIVKPQTTKEND